MVWEQKLKSMCNNKNLTKEMIRHFVERKTNERKKVV